MIMKYICTLLIAFAATVPLFSQTFTISGTVEEENGTPVEFANVTLTPIDSAQIVDAVTDRNGKFAIAAVPNNYTLSISFIGYESHRIELKIDKNTDIGPIQLKVNKQLLQEVTVVGQRALFERRIDRLVFNVENSMAATSSDIMDVLRVVPGLRVSDDQISMISKGSMIVTVNDRVIPLSGESLTNYLKGISPMTIKSIEVITNPPARYSAEGNAGIINIVLKRAVNDSWNLTLRSMYRKPVVGSGGNAGADFNYKKNRLSAFMNTTFQKANSNSYPQNTIYYPTEEWKEATTTIWRQRFFSLNTGADYDVSDRWRIGVMYFVNKVSNPGGISETNTTIFDSGNELKESKISLRENSQRFTMHSANINSFIKLNTSGKSLSIDLDYINIHSLGSLNNSGDSYNPDNAIIRSSHFANDSRHKGNHESYSAKTDISLPLAWANLSMGVRYSFTEINNDFLLHNIISGNPVIDPNLTNLFRYRESIHAAYISGNRRITDKLYLQAGLRMENTATEGYSKTMNETNRKNYLQFFPTAYLQYKFNDKRSVVLSYGRRLSRPSFATQNPFRSYINEYSYSEGNPYLLPSFSHYLEMAYTIYPFECKIWYLRTTGEIVNFPFLDAETQVVRYVPINGFNFRRTGITASYNFNKFWWWNSSSNAEIYYVHKTAAIEETGAPLNTFSATLFTGNDIMLNRNKTLIFNIGGTYWFPYVNGAARTDATYMIRGGFRARLLDENLTLALNVIDIFNTGRFRQTEESNGIKYLHDFSRMTSRVITLSVSYRIGNRQISTLRRMAGNQEERERSM